MALQTQARQTQARGSQADGGDSGGVDRWYARSPEEVAAAFGVDPAAGLSAAQAAQLLASHGPNALPEEKPKPEWQRFLAEYRTFMQIILVAAGVVMGAALYTLVGLAATTAGVWVEAFHLRRRSQPRPAFGGS